MVPQKDRLLYTNAYQEVTGKPISLITPEELAMKAGDVDKIVAPILLQRATGLAEAVRKPDVLTPEAEKQKIRIAKASKEVKETPEQRRAAQQTLKKEFHQFKLKIESEKPGKRTPNQQRLLDKDIADYGSLIMKYPENEEVKPHIAYVNKYLSKENYIYTWTKKKGFFKDKGKAVRVELPRGASAADIKFTMKQEKKGLNEVLKQLGLIE